MSVAALNTPLREVRLYGVLAKRFGRVHWLAVQTAAEAMSALCAVLPGFEAYLRQHSEPGYHVFIGKRKAGCDLAEQDLARPVGQQEPIMLVPALAGAKRAGTLQVILGAVLVVAGVFVALAGNPALGASISKLGFSLMFGGVVQMVTAPKKAAARSEVDTRSFAFDAVVNTDEEGLPVPLAIGRLFIGGARVSAGMTSDEYPPPPAATLPPATLPDYMPQDSTGGDAGGFGEGDADADDGSDSDGVDGFGDPGESA